MFWRRRGREVYEERQRVSGPLADPVEPPAARPLSETIEIEPGAPRPASISRVAEELGRRGEEVVELFKEVVSPAGGRGGVGVGGGVHVLGGVCGPGGVWLSAPADCV